ncbi:MAG: hypothetical protein ABH952_09620 [Candidatus Omnitrophota bacterium]
MAKKKEPTPKISEERETRVLLEEIRSSVKTVAEQVGTIKEEILSEVKSEIGQVKSELDIVKMAVMENSRKISDLKSGQERIEQKLDTNIANHEQRITKIEEKVGV